MRSVLIDTIDKATGTRLLKKSSNGGGGFLGSNQVKDAENFARKLGIKLLWAGGLGLREAYAMGKPGVFDMYVTSARRRRSLSAEATPEIRRSPE